MRRLPEISFVAAAACGHPDAAPVAAVPAPPTAPAEPSAPAADELAPGLAVLRVPLPGGAPDDAIDIIRADPARFRLRVLTASHDGSSHPAPDWREIFHLAAVTNAGMFHGDGAPVGLIVEDGAAIGADNPKFGGVIAFEPRDPHDAAALVTGRDCPSFDLAALRRRYRSLVQSSRLLGCDGKPLHWGDPKRYSAAAIGVDRAGRIVMLHARAARTMTDLALALAQSDLDLAGALFLEGGPEASLVARGDGGELRRVGSYETGFWENDDNRAFWWLPNVLALAPR